MKEAHMCVPHAVHLPLKDEDYLKVIAYMPIKQYYAHSKENRHPENWQTMKEHLKI